MLMMSNFSYNAITINDYKKELSDLQKEKEYVQKNQAEIQKKIDEANAEILKISEKMILAEQEKTAISQQITKNELDIAEKKEQIKDLIVFSQKSSSDNFYLNYLFGAENFTDFIYRISIIQQLTKKNSELMDQMNKLIEDGKTKQEELEETKSEKKILIIFASIFTGLIVLAAVIVFLLPHISKGKTLSVPDVSKLSKVEATNKLVKQGFTVSCGEEDYKYDSSDTIEEGYAIKTSPEAGTMVKEGKTICIIISSGENTFQLEDYTGMNYFEVKGILDTKCKDLCNVIIEKEKVKETDTYEDNTVIKTSPEKGTTIKKGDTIKLFIPDKEVLYPDFTTYTVEQVDEFAKKYNLTVEKKYVENSLLPPGTITNQSRSKGTVVTSPGEFSITITKTPDVVEDIILPDEE